MFFALQATTTRAQTILGGNITWECLGGDQYNVALNVYVDCFGLASSTSAFPQTVDIVFYPDASCTGPTYNAFSAYADSTSMTEISDLCPTELINSSCNNAASANLGVKKITYETQVALTAGCVWTASYSGLDWSFYFENTTPVFLQDAYIFSEINTAAATCGLVDILPDVDGGYISYFCAQPSTAEQHDIQISLPAGVTATYAFGLAYTSGATANAPVAIGGFSIPAGLTLNPASGLLSWTPPALPLNSPTQVYIVPVDIELNAGGTYVGTVRHNLTLAVRDCSLTDTAFDPVPVTVVGTDVTYTNNPGATNDVLEVCAGNLLSFTVQASNVNLSRNITITYAFSPPAPGLAALTMTQSSLAPGISNFELQTTAAMASGTPYTLTLHAQDDACPIADDDDIEIEISILPNIAITSAPDVICAGDIYTLQAEGAGASNQYTWSVQPGGDATPVLTQNVATQNVSPDSTTTYRVSTPLNTGSCQSEDFVTVDVSLHRLQLDAVDESCGTLGSIDLTPLGTNSANLTYNWVAGAGGAGIVNGQQDQSGLQGTAAGATYTVTVNDLTYGCAETASVSIGETAGPEFTLSAPATVCENDNATVIIDFTAGQAPFDVWTTNPVGGAPNLVDIADPYNYVIPIPANTTVTVVQVRDANGCVSDPATVPQSETITARPLVTSVFDPEGPLCLGDALELTINHSDPGSYSVVYSIGGTNQPAVIVADNGTINVADPAVAGVVTYDIESISYTDTPACPSNDAANASINVTTHANPTATLPDGFTATACQGNSAIIQMTLTGDGPWVVQYTRDGAAQPALNIPDNPANPNYIYAWSLTVAGEYCITQVSDANCSSTVTNECADVVINPLPSLVSYTINGEDATTSPVDVCQGDNIVIEAVVTPVGNNYSYEFIGTPNIGIGLLNNQSSSFSQTITAASNFSLELDKIYFTSAPTCLTQLDETIAVNIRTDIQVAQTDLVCDNVGENYTIEFTITGGVTPYTEAVGGIGGSFSGNIFTTSSLVSGGTGGSWTFNDVFNCNTVTMTDAGYTCPSITNGGVMTASSLSICSPAAAPAQATATQSTPYTADANDAFMFVLHTNAANVLGSEIARSCGNAIFGDANTPLSFGATSGPGVIVSGTVYYISCVVGNNDGAGCVDEANPNIQFSANTQSVVWYISGTATLSAPSGIDACFGEQVSLEVDFTGNGPWTFVYSIDGVNQPSIAVPAANPYTFNASQTGSYAVEALTNSAQNCLGIAAGSVDVVIHPLPSVALSGDASICGGLTHCFDLAFTGEEPFTVVINVPNVAANETVANLLTNDQYCTGVEGAYQLLQVTDGFNCEANVNVSANLAIYPEVSAAWLSNSQSYCPNEPTITASFSATGDGPFTVDIQGPDPANPPVIVGSSITINDPGTYSIVSVTDTHGCVNTTGDDFEAIELTIPAAAAGSDVAQCAGLPVTLGTPALGGVTYSWSPSAGIAAGQADDAQPTVTINNANNSPYTYTLSVSDGSCSNSDEVIVTIQPNPSLNVTTTDDILCFDAPNNTATLTATPTGAGVYSYSWAASASIIGPDNQASVNIDPTINEIFEVTASEDFGTVTCSTTETIAIEVNDPIQITNLVYPTDMCNGTCVNEVSQDIDFDVTGAFNNAFTASIDGNSATAPICFDDPEDHVLLVADAEGCEASENFTIDVREQEYVMADTDQPYPFCFSDLDGVVEGNNPNASQYVLSESGMVIGVAEQTPFVFTDLGIGTYALSVNILLSSGQVCTADSTFTISPDSPEIFITPNPPAILGCPNYPITFDALVSGGAGNFTTYWNGCPEANGCLVGITNESANQNLTVVLSQDTTLFFYALDAIGCSSDTITAVGTISSSVSLFVQNGLDTLNTCQYDCEELTALATGGTGNLLIEWYELNDIVDLTPTLIASVDTITECFLFDGIFEIRVTDENCPLTSVSDTLWVTVHDTPEPIMDADESGSCYPDTIGFYYTLLDTNYNDLSTCIWSLGNGTQLSYCGDTAVVYTSPGNFFPSLTITSEFGCVGTDTLSTPITIRNYPEVDFTWDPQPVDILHRQVHFRNLTAGADSIYWNFYNAGESFFANPVWTFPDIETTDPYLICLTAANEYGCLDTLCQDVFVENILQVYVPNTFTPDGDGLNDVFIPIVNGEVEGSYRFWVYNRWGDIVFYTEEVGKAWTGGYDGGTYYVQDGYYLWKIEVDDLETGKPKSFEGNIFILR
jgi:gliding motility-associated-like protein